MFLVVAGLATNTDVRLYLTNMTSGTVVPYIVFWLQWREVFPFHPVPAHSFTVKKIFPFWADLHMCSLKPVEKPGL